MTVCTASAFLWNYAIETGKTEFGPAIIAASDRMLTDEGLGIEYSASRWKGCVIARKFLVMVAGAIVVHSDCLAGLTALSEQNPSLTVREIANAYGSLISNYRRKEAARLYLEPLGLNLDSFGQRTLRISRSLEREVTNQLQGHRIEAEALVLGCEGNFAHICHVDRHGVVTYHDDIGFASVGTGGIHSSAYFMRLPYTHAIAYYPAMFSTFLAKKSAEVAPGVSSQTDMFCLNREGVQQLPIELIVELEKFYEKQKTEWIQIALKVEEDIAIIDRSLREKSAQSKTSVLSAGDQISPAV